MLNIRKLIESHHTPKTWAEVPETDLALLGESQRVRAEACKTKGGGICSKDAYTSLHLLSAIPYLFAD